MAEEKQKIRDKQEAKQEKETELGDTKKQDKPKEEAIKKTEEKIELEREYIVPLRKKVQKVPRYKRAKKAIRVLKEFLARHMRVEDRDLRKIKIDKYLNQEIWFRGIKNPPSKIKVKAVKKSGIVYVELAEIPEKVKWDMKKEKKKLEKIDKKALKKLAEKEKSEKELKEKREVKEDKTEEKEKEKASVEAGLIRQEKQAKEAKHTTNAKQTQKSKHQVRIALKK